MNFDFKENPIKTRKATNESIQLQNVKELNLAKIIDLQYVRKVTQDQPAHIQSHQDLHCPCFVKNDIGFM